jgi:branched-chain amino acid transport system substrate-binding protein
MESVKGMEFKLDEVGWKIAGKEIKFMKQDHASNPVTAVDKARKLVERDKVHGILGPMFTPAGISVADYLTESKTPNICVHAQAIQVTQFGGGNVFVWAGTNRGVGYPLGQYAFEKMGFRKATALHIDLVEGETFAGGAINGFKSRGGTVVQVQKVPPLTMDFSPYLTAMKKADFFLYWQMAVPTVPFLKQYHDFGKRMPILMPLCGPAKESVLAEVGDSTLGMIGSDWYTPLLDTQINRKYVQGFKKKYGKYPRSESTGGYIAMTMFLYTRS